MNYKRGLLRAWIVFSVLWGAGFGWASWQAYDCTQWTHALAVKYQEMRDVARSKFETAPMINPNGLDMVHYNGQATYYSDESAKYYGMRNRCGDEMKSYGGLAAGVPIALLVLFFVGLWIRRGFQQPKGPATPA
jgi:hypothetical protein